MSQSPDPGSSHFNAVYLYRSLRRSINNEEILLEQYCTAFRELAKLLPLFGTIFVFVSKDVSDKLVILHKHMTSADTEKYRTVKSMVEFERSSGFLKTRGTIPNGCRTLLRLHRAMRFLEDLCRRLLRSYELDHQLTLSPDVAFFNKLSLSSQSSSMAIPTTLPEPEPTATGEDEFSDALTDPELESEPKANTVQESLSKSEALKGPSAGSENPDDMDPIQSQITMPGSSAGQNLASPLEVCVAADEALSSMAFDAYQKHLAPYHTWVVRKAVRVAVYALPTRAHMLEKMVEAYQNVCIDSSMYPELNERQIIELMLLVCDLLAQIYTNIQALYAYHDILQLP